MLPMERRQDECAAAEEKQQPPPHFLIVTYPAQGHITPARHLARRLVHAADGGGARVTICMPVSAFRKMFPEATAAGADGEEIREEEGGIAYAAYSDGYDGGFDRATDDYARYMLQVRLEGARTLSGLLRRLGDRGRPVTCAVYTLLLPWVAAVAREHGVATVAVFWIQPTTALAAYYHYFRGSREAVVAAAASRDPTAEVRIPGLPPLMFRDLPSFLAVTSDDDPFACAITEFRELIDALERDGDSGKPPTYVLANTFDAMERDALASLRPHVEVITVGPVLSFLHGGDNGESPNDLFEHDTAEYLHWLDTMPAKSVVYISFGSTSVMSKTQVAEIADAMKQADKPFLWVLRRNNCREQGDDDAIKKLLAAATGGGGGKVVEWCDQARVLSHPSVGCFVTHCGWNSTLESVACGVPTVAVPQYSDQGTNAWLVDRVLGVGVRAAARSEDGVLEARELTRCVEVEMSEAVTARAGEWKEKARAAVADGGASDRSLREFVRRIASGS
ncbi:UDP-glycosyltransferase 75C1-like [Lolium rigidum]|uniref:UDP-glycosyltransferase 75C1-like n=1 Tax=Lolium rigidum TaxID=89674 RepID=UPI001F5D6D5B|nr:UDP-glycosyltransferase 75C1-like [Lolium rigidum]